MYSSTVTLPASQTRPRSLRSRSMSMMCSARSLGCATSSAVSRRSCSGDPWRAARAGDGPRRNRRGPSMRSSRSGDDDRIDSCRRTARWRRTAPGSRGAARRRPGAGSCRLAQPQPPGPREVRLVDVAGGDVFLARARTRARNCSGRFLRRAIASGSGAVRIRATAAASACCEIARSSRACAAASPSCGDGVDACRCARSCTARCSTRSANAEYGASRRRQSQAAARFPRELRSRDRRTSRRGTAAASSRGIAACASRAIPGLEIVEESAGDQAARRCAVSSPSRIAQQRGAGLGGQHAEARQRALRGAVEEHRITRRDRVAASVRSAAPGTATAVMRGARASTRMAKLAAQPLKRRKISEPLVPPKPKEFDSAASIATLRAVFGT